MSLFRALEASVSGTSRFSQETSVIAKNLYNYEEVDRKTFLHYRSCKTLPEMSKTLSSINREIDARGGFENFITNLSWREENNPIYIDKILEAKKLNFEKCATLMPRHLTFIAECYKRFKGFKGADSLEITITNCEHIKKSDLDVFKDSPIKTNFS